MPKKGERALDWLNFFVADVQTGFGPFIAVYLVTQEWTDTQIGFALSIGTFTAMASQVPAGALVDATAAKRGVALAALIAIAVSALIFALWPATLPVMIAEVAHGFASCLFVPAAASISLGLVGRRALSIRLGRNARFKAIGNSIAAGIMGLAGSYITGSSVFWLTAILTAPAIVALANIPANELQRDGTIPEDQDWKKGLRKLVSDRGVLVFAGCCALFGLANTAMLPLAGSEMTANMGEHANLLIGACIVVPQIMVAMLSPLMGRLANTQGRRIALIIGFTAVASRGVLLALLSGYPELVVLVQTLDGVSASMLGVLLPLLAADLTRGTNRFNLCIGVFGLANGLGATVSTVAAGSIADSFAASTAFLALAIAGGFAVLLAWLAMPETMQSKEVLAASELVHRF